MHNGQCSGQTQQLQDKPTSGSCLTDLYALADMGAMSVDIKTALGAVEEAHVAALNEGSFGTARSLGYL